MILRNIIELKGYTVENHKHRLFFLDNIKIFLTIIVIIHHAGQAYGPTGGFWEYKSSLGESILALGRFFAVNSAYFMGFFFLISGYIIVLSFDKNNGKGFIKKRLIKLGIPLLFIFLIIKPLQMYFHYIHYSGNVPLSFFQYYLNIWYGLNGMPEGFIVTDVFPEMNFGHAWYIEHLLVYSLIYWLFRTILKNRAIRNQETVLSISKVLLVAIITAVSTAIVMNWYLYDESIGLFGFFQVEVAHWPQYLVMLFTGCIAYRKNWLFNLNSRTGYSLLAIAVLIVVVVYAGVPFPSVIVWGIVSSFLAVCLVFGMITLFRDKLNKTTPFISVISRSSYTAYLIHFPIVLSIQYSLDKVSFGGAWGKFIIVSILSVAITYCASCFFLKVKYLNKVL